LQINTKNVKHSNTSITDEIYSSLKEAEIIGKILSLGNGNSNEGNNQQVIEALELMLENSKQ
jgi:hypothetical protein